MAIKTTAFTAALLALLAVILGALGAHALETVLDPDQLDSFKTGVRYQMWHALAILATLPLRNKIKGLAGVQLFWLLGTLLFSFSIYFLSLQKLWQIDLSWLGPVTPLGGLLMIVGWGLLLWRFLRHDWLKV